MPPAKGCRGIQKEVRGVPTDDEIWGEILEIEVQDVAVPGRGNEFTEALARLYKFLITSQRCRGRAVEGARDVVQKLIVRKFALSILQRMPRDAARAMHWGEVRSASRNGRTKAGTCQALMFGGNRGPNRRVTVACDGMVLDGKECLRRS